MVDPPTKIRLAIAEDHHVTAEGLSGWFSRSVDFAVVGNCSHREAIAPLLSTSAPDILLLDLHMPGEPGVRDILSMTAAHGVKTVIFSADNRPYFVQLSFDHGVAAFLLKTETFTAVANVLHRVYKGESRIASSGLILQSPVTQSEQQILLLLAQGRKYQEIADARGTSTETVRNSATKS